MRVVGIRGENHAEGVSINGRIIFWRGIGNNVIKGKVRR